jgi:hypothetical protein
MMVNDSGVVLQTSKQPPHNTWISRRNSQGTHVKYAYFDGKSWRVQ